MSEQDIIRGPFSFSLTNKNSQNLVDHSELSKLIDYLEKRIMKNGSIVSISKIMKRPFDFLAI